MANLFFYKLIISMISNGIKFSPIYTRGSTRTHNIIRTQLSEHLYSEVMDLFASQACTEAKNNPKAGEFISKDQLREIFVKILPEPLNFKIQTSTKKDVKNNLSASMCAISNKQCMEGYRLILPLKDNQLYIEDIPELLHEAGHLLDYALNPQYTANLISVGNKDFYKKLGEIYEKFYYTITDYSLFRIKRVTKALLKNMSCEDKLNALKNIKLRLITESNAYLTENHYWQELKKHRKGMKKPPPPSPMDFRFREKIRLINSMRYKIVAKERKNISKT